MRGVAHVPYTMAPVLRYDWNRWVNAAGNPVCLNLGTLGAAGDAVGIGGAGNPTALVNGYPGYRYDGGDALSVPANARLRPTEAVTVEAWASATALASLKMIVNGCGNTAAANDAYMLFWNSNVLRFAINNWNVSFAWIAFTDTTDKIYHIVGTYDRQNVRIYLNGVAGTSAVLVAAINYLGVKPFEIGRLVGAYYWTGRICSVRVYPGIVLPATAIRAIFESERRSYGV